MLADRRGSNGSDTTAWCRSVSTERGVSNGSEMTPRHCIIAYVSEEDGVRPVVSWRQQYVHDLGSRTA